MAGVGRPGGGGGGGGGGRGSRAGRGGAVGYKYGSLIMQHTISTIASFVASFMC